MLTCHLHDLQILLCWVSRYNLWPSGASLTDLISVHRGGRVEIIANDQGHRITPSWVAFGDEERLVGDSAKNAFHSNPENTVFDAKRLMGRKMDDPDIKKDMKHWCVPRIPALR